MRNFKLTLLLGLLVLTIAGCGIKKMVQKYPEVDIKLENPDLENKGGRVEYTIKGTVPPKYLKKKAAMEIEVPYLVYDQATGEAKKAIDKITLVGEKSKASGTKIPYKTGGNFSKTGSFEFSEEYLNADIDAATNISMGKKSQDMPNRKLGEGISNTSSLVNINPEFQETDHDGKVAGNGTFILNAPHQYKPDFVTKTGSLYFEVNVATLNLNLKLNRDQEAKNRLKEVLDLIYEERIIDKVVINAWASPEGEESRNQDLSVKRAEATTKWFNQQLDKYISDYAKKNKLRVRDVKRPELVIENNANGEDWTGFETAVEKSGIAEKNQILNVVRSQPTSAMKEQKIREMTDIYTEIKDVILPPLRRGEVALTYNNNNFNEAQIMEYATTNPAVLSANEKLYAASKTNDVRVKEAIYNSIINTESTQADWRAYNNLAVIYLNDVVKGNVAALAAAKDNLNKANAIAPSNGIILNNIAIATFLSGDIIGAKTKFEESQKAVSFPVSQGYNLGMYKILDGDYAAAKNAMNRHCDYNTALAQLVSKEYQAAKTTLDCIPNQDAKVCYLKAIVGARTGSQADVLSNLRLAIEKDATLKAKANKDPEFKKYRSNAEFQTIVK